MRRSRWGSSGGREAAKAAADCSFQEKIDFEMRMREGICKLLAVSTQKDQLLHAVKNLMVCNARIRAYRTELQRQAGESTRNNTTTGRGLDFAAKERTACRGKIAISGLRIPLMWKGSDHFSSKDRTQRYSVFCLLKVGAQVFDTELLIVDKAITDICFESEAVFDEVGPDFQLKIEVYSCCCSEESFAIANTPKKLVNKLKTSIGKATGKKLSSALDEGNLDSLLLSDTVVLGAKYGLLAYTSLGLESVEDSFKTHSLTVVTNEESSFWLPLYGNMCCRLVGQPFCMTDDMMTGFLNQQQAVGKLTTWRKLYCVLRGGKLICYCTPEEIEAKVEPALTVSVNKETRIRAVDKDTQKRNNNFSVINPEAGKAVTQIFAVESREDLYKWMEAFWQHFYDFSQWKQCCEEFMKIEIMSPRKPPLFLAKEATLVYQDMSIDSPVKHGALIDKVQRKSEETNRALVFGQEEKYASPSWAAMFDGSHHMLVQKSTPPEANVGAVNVNEGKGKKRRAPPPPSDKLPDALKAQVSDRGSKENIWNCSPVTRRTCSSDSSSSAVLHYKQPFAISPKPTSCQKGTFTDDENPVLSATKVLCDDKPIPAPRKKSLKEKLDPRSRLQSLV
uniref:Rhotekin-2 n=1 Tax=Anolis carolinensis TaxID=28377 RepID=H9GGX6_ANOCA|nr:PREDICTED: rhotekin-2 isoform X1 [Anolis carolinensis]|eukprot:XP_008112966.1 PREDICTED: rhotekin-2 isoform X1 [Anolis carolinensis]